MDNISNLSFTGIRPLKKLTISPQNKKAGLSRAEWRAQRDF